MGRVVVLSLVLLAASVGCRPDDERSRSGPTPVTTTIHRRAGTLPARRRGYRVPVDGWSSTGSDRRPVPTGPATGASSTRRFPEPQSVPSVTGGWCSPARWPGPARDGAPPDGLRTSYSYLATIEVSVGDPVGPGQSVGTSTARLHLGVRAGAAYIDPALLFGPGGVRLVPIP